MVKKLLKSTLSLVLVSLMLLNLASCTKPAGGNDTSSNQPSGTSSVNDSGQNVTKETLPNNLEHDKTEDEIISEEEKMGLITEGMLGGSGIQVSSYEGFLGYGYNMITSSYYNYKEIKSSFPIIDVDTLAQEGAVYVDSRFAHSINKKTIVANSTKEYAQSLSRAASVKGDFLLTGSFSVNFNVDADYEMKSNQSLVTIQALLETRKDYIDDADAERLAAYATSNFIRDVQKMTPEALVERYGTHVLANVSMGGRFDLNYLYTKKNTSSTVDVQTSAEASYKYVSGTAETKDKENKKEIEENSSLQVRTYGGTVALDTTSITKAIESHQQWSTSVENGNISLVNASELVPIWEVAKYLKIDGAEDKAKAIEKYCYDTAKGVSDHFKGTTSYVSYIENIYIAAGNTETEAKNQLRAKGVLEGNILNVDLNKGAGGKWIYLGYTTTDDKTKAVTYLAADYYSKKQTKDIVHDDIPLTIIDVDLNAGAGGKYIYLYYSKSQKIGKPITEIKYQVNDQFEYGNANGYKSVLCLEDDKPMDFNRSIKGSPYIYLWYKTE